MAQVRTPRERAGLAERTWGLDQTVVRCCAMAAGHVDGDLLRILGGASADQVLAGMAGGPDGYWPRTWALRALLYLWAPAAEPQVVSSCGDPHWRVREMAFKVVAARELHSEPARAAIEQGLLDDHWRVRSAAERAQRRV